MFLIAESKTMAAGSREIAACQLKAHTPLYEAYAGEIMRRLSRLSSEELTDATCLSAKLAGALGRMAYEFPNKTVGEEAICAFTGVVFRQLRLKGYDAGQTEWLARNVRIISSLYGWLRPDDIIKPYRLEFKNKVAPDGLPLMKFWRSHVTIALVRELKERHDAAVYDLLPADVSKCIDWKLVKRFAKVYRIDFKTPVGSQDLKTPGSGRLKQLRGSLLDLAITHRCTDTASIASLESDDFLPQGEIICPGTLTYFTD